VRRADAVALVLLVSTAGCGGQSARSVDGDAAAAGDAPGDRMGDLASDVAEASAPQPDSMELRPDGDAASDRSETSIADRDGPTEDGGFVSDGRDGGNSGEAVDAGEVADAGEAGDAGEVADLGNVAETADVADTACRPDAADTCKAGDDSNCNGVPNEGCACIDGFSASCQTALGAKGACATGTARCAGGKWGACSIQPKGSDTCDPDNDDNCNGVADEGCACVNGSTAKCGDKLGAIGTCAAGTTTCANGHWGTCDVAPKATDSCEAGNDDSCDGKALTGCTCGDGFKMPNDSSTDLPNRAKYVDNGDGSVTDLVTGLVWERAVDPGYIFPTQESAANYCSGKTGGWRLPTILELLSLVDINSVWSLNSLFPAPPIEHYKFWASTPLPDPDFWLLILPNGIAEVRSDPDSFNFGMAVRCVSITRSPSVPPRCFTTRYQSRGTDELYDAVTGLTWQKTFDWPYTWDEAKDRCAARGAGWRLPGYLELESIRDFTGADPPIDLTLFPGTTASTFWTSTPARNSTGDSITAFHAVPFSDPYWTETDLLRSQDAAVRCVR
jgi:hypothetical protein